MAIAEAMHIICLRHQCHHNSFFGGPFFQSNRLSSLVNQKTPSFYIFNDESRSLLGTITVHSQNFKFSTPESTAQRLVNLENECQLLKMTDGQSDGIVLSDLGSKMQVHKGMTAKLQVKNGHD